MKVINSLKRISPIDWVLLAMCALVGTASAVVFNGVVASKTVPTETKQIAPEQIIIERVIEETTVEKPYVKQTNIVMPDGHWEKYCLYPENEFGYRTSGAMIRVSGGDCKSNWRIVEVWEK